MLLVTGGAGFIGSNAVAALNDASRADIAGATFLVMRTNGAISPSASWPLYLSIERSCSG